MDLVGLEEGRLEEAMLARRERWLALLEIQQERMSL